MIYNWLVIMWTRIPASCDLDIYLKHVGRYLKKKKKSLRATYRLQSVSMPIQWDFIIILPIEQTIGAQQMIIPKI